MEWSEYAPTDPYEVAMNNEFTAFWLTVRSHQLISPLVELPKNDWQLILFEIDDRHQQ